MHDLTHEELAFIGNVLGQLTFKAGQSDLLITVESIIKKLEQEAVKYGVDLTQLSKEKES